MMTPLLGIMHMYITIPDKRDWNVVKSHDKLCIYGGQQDIKKYFNNPKASIDETMALRATFVTLYKIRIYKQVTQAYQRLVLKYFSGLNYNHYAMSNFSTYKWHMVSNSVKSVMTLVLG